MEIFRTLVHHALEDIANVMKLQGTQLQAVYHHCDNSAEMISAMRLCGFDHPGEAPFVERGGEKVKMVALPSSA